jgi:hypothetical protein
MGRIVNIALRPRAGDSAGGLLELADGGNGFVAWDVGDTLRFSWPALPQGAIVLRATVSFMPKEGIYHQTPAGETQDRNVSSILLAMHADDGGLAGTLMPVVSGRWCFGVMLTTNRYDPASGEWLERWVLPDPETGDGNAGTPLP